MFSSWITLGKPPYCTEKSSLYVGSELLPKRQAFRSSREIHSSRFILPIFWSKSAVHVARWFKDSPGSIPVSVKGVADERCYRSRGGVKLISFSRATGDWQWDFITSWVPSSVLGRLCHTESQSNPEKTDIAESHMVGELFLSSAVCFNRIDLMDLCYSDHHITSIWANEWCFSPSVNFINFQLISTPQCVQNSTAAVLIAQDVISHMWFEWCGWSVFAVIKI